MKVPVSWLREFVDVKATPEDIAARMSVRGFAVEGIEKASDDIVLDFEVTANRPDCMSVIGIAREVATAFGVALKGERRPPSAPQAGDCPDITITIENFELCPMYVGSVADVTIGASPDWMQARLRACGIRPISNIVDVTNYVLLELGQPMHAFDHAKLEGQQIRVRTAQPGERITTLDGQQRELTSDMLVIADAVRPVAVAGVMGGGDSEVSDGTRVIVFESAYFNPLSVRRTSKKLGLKTEASMRFERGADRMMPPAALNRACELLEQIGAGAARCTTFAGENLQAYFSAAFRAMTLRPGRLAGLLGVDVPAPEVLRILGTLGFMVQETPDGWTVMIPPRRVDIDREEDLIEEIARHYGFDRIPSAFPALTSAAPSLDPRITRARQVRQVMTGAGFSEALTFGFMGEAAAAPFAPEGDLVPIANPLSENFAVLRPSALPGLVDAVAHNRRREQRDVRLFEIGNRFSRAHGERRAVACAWTGYVGGDHWSGGSRPADFFDMKGVVERLADALGIEIRTDTCRENWLVQGRSAAIVTGESTRIGVLGQLSPALADAHGLTGADALYVAEIDLDAADALGTRAPLQVEPLPKFPSATRDISVLVDDTLAARTLRDTVRGAAPATLVRVREFDRYAGKGIAEGKVSVSLRLTFRSPDRTLTDTEVQNAMDAVLTALKAGHGAVQR